MHEYKSAWLFNKLILNGLRYARQNRTITSCANELINLPRFACWEDGRHLNTKKICVVLQDALQMFGATFEHRLDAGNSNTGRGAHSYTCPICKRQFSGKNRRQHYENHLLTHTGEKPYACRDCPYRSSRKDTLYVHIRKKHSQMHPQYAEQPESILQPMQW